MHKNRYIFNECDSDFITNNVEYDSIVDGEGMRIVLWTQGCPHNCIGCHNPSTHSFKDGFLTNTEDIIKDLSENIKYHDGITLSGGDPFIQAKAVNEIASYIKSEGKDVWAYTGYDFEELLKSNNKDINNLLSNIDVLVDGKFILEEFSMDLYYRGSRNQRIIDVKKSLKYDKVILIDKYMKEKNNKSKYEKKDYIFV